MLRQLMPFQRELLGYGYVAFGSAAISTVLAGIAFSFSSGSIYALSLALWAPPIFATGIFCVSLEIDNWKRAIHTLPIPRLAKQNAHWWVYVIVIPCVYSIFANCIFVFAGYRAGVPWPWYRVFELPIFYMTIHALLFLSVALTRRLSIGSQLAATGLCATPFVLNSHALLPTTPIYYPVICLLAIALSYRWRTELFRFEFQEFSRFCIAQPVNGQSVNGEIADSDFDFVADSATAVAWGQPRPFRAQIMTRAKQAILLTTFVCAILAFVFWFLGVQFSGSVLPSVTVACLGAIASSASLNFNRTQIAKPLRASPVSREFLIRFVVGLRLTVPCAAGLGASPWLWIVWDQQPVWIGAGILYGMGLSLLILGTAAILVERNKERLSDEVDDDPMTIFGMVIILAAIAAPFCSRYVFLGAAPIVFIGSIVTISFISKRYSLI